MKHEDYETTDVIVHNSGWCFWIPPMTTYTYCKLDFTYWPWDIQNCVITYGSWTKSGWELDLHNMNGKNVRIKIFLYKEDLHMVQRNLRCLYRKLEVLHHFLKVLDAVLLLENL